MLAANVFRIIHSEFGEEHFEITWARYNLYKNDDGVWELTIGCLTGKALRQVPELETALSHLPDFEVTARLRATDLELYPGRIITQEHAYDYERDEYLSYLYYFDHTSIEDVRIEILEVDSNGITVFLHGKTRIHGDNGHEPDAELFVSKTRFEWDATLRRGVS